MHSKQPSKSSVENGTWPQIYPEFILKILISIEMKHGYVVVFLSRQGLLSFSIILLPEIVKISS